MNSSSLCKLVDIGQVYLGLRGCVACVNRVAKVGLFAPSSLSSNFIFGLTYLRSSKIRNAFVLGNNVYFHQYISDA